MRLYISFWKRAENVLCFVDVQNFILNRSPVQEIRLSMQKAVVGHTFLGFADNFLSDLPEPQNFYYKSKSIHQILAVHLEKSPLRTFVFKDNLPIFVWSKAK